MSTEAGTYPTYPNPPEAWNVAESPAPAPDEAPGPELLDAEELAESLTGFDQIAIRQHFRERFDEIAPDGPMLLRVLYFIHLRRANGSGREGDKAAYVESMGAPLGELKAMYADEDAGADPDDESAVAERDRQFAEFVAASGIPYTVEQYMALTLGQRNAVYEAVSKTRR